MNAETSIKAPFDRDRQFAAKRRAVILSAASAFRRRGYHNTSMVDIAKTLGLTKAALYYYVRNKEEILFESHLMAYDSMDEILKQTDTENISGLECLEKVFRDFVDLLTHSGVSLLTDVDSLSAVNRAQVLRRRGQIERQVITYVKTGQKDGSIRQADSRLQVFFFMGALNWLNAWFDSDGRLQSDDIADHFVEQMRSGIAAGVGEPK